MKSSLSAQQRRQQSSPMSPTSSQQVATLTCSAYSWCWVLEQWRYCFVRLLLFFCPELWQRGNAKRATTCRPSLSGSQSLKGHGCNEFQQLEDSTRYSHSYRKQASAVGRSVNHRGRRTGRNVGEMRNENSAIVQNQPQPSERMGFHVDPTRNCTRIVKISTAGVAPALYDQVDVSQIKCELVGKVRSLENWSGVDDAEPQMVNLKQLNDRRARTMTFGPTGTLPSHNICSNHPKRSDHEDGDASSALLCCTCRAVLVRLQRLCQSDNLAARKRHGTA